ncbi:4,5-DOPA dioxygenase extradiol 1-like [Aristolochia californica]|uniref:4,5-DOPA dioxygenase extradiol 1-like n=1 Tax=Aristolochia californica TaxID=171875 RepID=UPI0035E11CE5
MDTFFIGHGAPTVAINASLPVRPFLQQWREYLGDEAQSFCVIFFHCKLSFTTNKKQHDEYPSALQLRYSAPGSPELAKQVKELLIKGGFEQVKEEKSRGISTRCMSRWGLLA